MTPIWKEGDTPIVGEFLELRRLAGLPSRSPHAAARGLSAGLHCVIVREGPRLIGMGRVVGDGGLHAFVTDLAVDPGWQGQGLGRQILDRLVAWCESELPRGCTVSLLPEPGSFRLFAESGFEIRTGMERVPR